MPDTKQPLFPFSREQADEQYDPVRWTRRLSADELLPAHERLTTSRSDSYRDQLGLACSVLPFGEGELAGQMDVYRPEGVAADAPIVVYIHGGWWQWFSKEAFGFLAEPFNEHGYAVVMPGYRMAQDWGNGAPMESIVAQMECALATVLEQAVASGAPSVHVVGHSAGGHLAALLHRTDWSARGLSEEARGKLVSVFSLAGLFDLRPLVDTYVNDEIGMSMSAAEQVSPQLLPVSPECRRPIHLVLPEFDTPEFFRQTREYQEKLLRAGGACRMHVVADRDHLDMIERLADPGDELLDYVLCQMARAEVLDASRRWIAKFNATDVAACAQAYAPDAQMCAAPVGTFEGRDQIETFWSSFTTETGAKDLRYENVQLIVESPSRAVLSAEWSMNVGRGIITRELWVKQDDGVWRLEDDRFEVQERF